MNRLLIILTLLFASSQLNAQWPLVNADMRPWTRWWWMGNAVDSTNIIQQLDKYKHAGFGGVEIVPIYGAKGHEDKFISYLSSDWLRMLDVTVKSAQQRDMGTYMSVGSGWPIGGPQVTVADAATKLRFRRFEFKDAIPQGTKFNIPDEKKSSETMLPQALMAYDDLGNSVDLLSKLGNDGSLNWSLPKGNWEVYVFFVSKTGQKVKRAAPGGQGFTLNHFSREAVGHYLKSFSDSLHNSSHGVQAMYNDSYEVFNADWSPEFFDDFLKLRGYDLRKYLNLFLSDKLTDSVAKIKSDYRETMSDIMISNFSSQFNSWSHGLHALSLNEAHGSPANLLDMYAGVDIAETESFGATHFEIKGLRRDSSDYRNVDPEPLMMKFASAAAHAEGHLLSSAESFTWLSEHFKTTWAQCKPEAENLFLAGINHLVYHGSTYSPETVAWPGWLFYASVEFVPENSLWSHLKALNDYVTRCQSVLQTGQPDNEILMYWPVYDAWANPKGMDLPFKVHDVNEWLQPTDFYKNTKALQENGYSIDFASDKMLERAFVADGEIGISKSGGHSKILIIPACKYMPLKTLQSIMSLAKEGATIIFHGLPQSIPGFLSNSDAEAQFNNLTKEIEANAEEPNGMYAKGKGTIVLNADIKDALNIMGIAPESLSGQGLQFIRRKKEDGKFYYIVNHTAKDIDTFIELKTKGASLQLLDPQTGTLGYTTAKYSTDSFPSVRLQIKSGGALIVEVTNKSQHNTRWTYVSGKGNDVVLNRPWMLHFIFGGPVLPKDTVLDNPVCWTKFSELGYVNFSGTAAYAQSFNLKMKEKAAYILSIPGLYESAHVFINDKDAGYIWYPPYELNVSAYLKQGKNSVRIEVANLMANRIRYMDKNKMEWRKYHEINFVNIDYKPFDASNWDVQRSGIDGAVILKELSVQQ